MINETVELFFAFDDAYAPLAAVTMLSVKENRSKMRSYNLHILHTGIGLRTISRLTRELSEDGFELYFHDISWAAVEMSEQLHTRDYYSKCTYYRLFISRLFPDIKKALYLDCDLILKADVAELFDTDISDSLVGAVPDGAVAQVPAFREYVERRLDLAPERYFNAGVLLMNLERMRLIGFEAIFRRLIASVKFDIAQDQDYLNVICRDNVKYIADSWNRMPLFPQEDGERVKIIHFNLDKKPWQATGIPFEEEFYSYAKRSAWGGVIGTMSRSYTDADRAKAAEATERLIVNAQREAYDEAECARIKKEIEAITRVHCEAV